MTIRVFLNTLAQKGTTIGDKQPIILTGKGSDIYDKGYGRRKCKNKTITDALLLQLIDIAKKDGRYDIVKSLWNTWHCQNIVYTHEGRLYTGKYCKNRFCRNCLGIRKAELINKYYPVLKEWGGAYFVTLTVKSCYKNMLPVMLKKCLQGLERIVDKYEKREARGKGKKLMGIRTLESNFNPIRKWYNPHLHIIVPDRETAEILVNEWLQLWRYKDPNRKPLADRKGQDIEKVWNMDAALIEVIKYGTKVFTDPEGKEGKGKPKGIVKIYTRAFYNITVAMKGLRLFGSFGFKLPKKDNVERMPAKVVSDYEKWLHTPEIQNWVNSEGWETLFDNLPDAKLEELLLWGIDTDSE